MCKLFVFLLSSLIAIQAQAQYSIGNWREHLPYREGRQVENAGTKWYCATPVSLFSFNPGDNSLNRYSRLSGLNDIGISCIRYSEDFKVLIIAYSNSNIDLLYEDGQVLNLSDIKRKNIQGNKNINAIYISGNLAYLACGFGIVVLDLSRKEIKDTYFIGPGGAAEQVFEVCSGNGFLFASTESAVRTASLSSPALYDFNSWSVLLGDTGSKGEFSQADFFANTLIVNYKRNGLADTLMAWNGAWGASLGSVLPFTSTVRALEAGATLWVVSSNSVSEYDASYNRLRLIDASVVSDLRSWDAAPAAAGVLIADEYKGLVLVNADNSFSEFRPEGPNSSQVSAMQSVNGRMWFIHGPRNRGWVNQFDNQGFSYYLNGKWSAFDGKAEQTPLFAQYNFYDNVTLAVDPSNSNRLFIGASGPGLLEFANDAPLAFFRDTNSTLLQQFGNPGQVKVHGIALDDQMNLWVSNAGVNRVLHVRSPQGQWQSFAFPGNINSNSKCGDLIIDRNGFKWLSIFENIGGKEGILVFSDNRTPFNLADDGAEIVEFGANRVRCMAVDLEGVVWTGTEEGIYIFYSPNLTPQQILIEQDNTFQYLLENEIVTAIAVDGANRKWVGTENAGVFLFSEDGTEEIEHFTDADSPLFSNTITAIAINDQTGEVFIATSVGLQSYQSDALPGEDFCTDVWVYPNPVQPEYRGPIAIRGVVSNGFFKITDINGGLVYEGRALGGQAIWDGTTLAGDRAGTGVYLVFSSDAAGDNTCTTKFVFYK